MYLSEKKSEFVEDHLHFEKVWEWVREWSKTEWESSLSLCFSFCFVDLRFVSSNLLLEDIIEVGEFVERCLKETD